MRLFLRILAGTLLLLSIVSAENMLVNGDFETGDLYGWIEAGPDTVPRYIWHLPSNGPGGNPPPPIQVFSADAPLYIYERFTDKESGKRCMRTIGLAPKPTPMKGYSAGYACTGVKAEMCTPWLSQIFHVAPGRYKVNISYDVAVSGGKGDKTNTICLMTKVHTDDRINEVNVAEIPLRQSTWNTQSKGEWVSKSLKDFVLETTTGEIEFRLLFNTSDEKKIGGSDYEFIAVDNVYFEMTPVSLDTPLTTGGKKKK